MSSLDSYTSRARVGPALIVVSPLGLLLLALLPDHPLTITVLLAILGTTGWSAIMAQVGRDPGWRKERALWDSWDGPPTTRFLRHRHTPGDPNLDLEMRRRVEEWAGRPLPTREEEEADPSGADRTYRRVVASLREATRDTTQFPLVFATNTNYGFRRNLLGLKSIGASATVVLAATAWALLLFTVLGRPWPDPWWNALVYPDSTATIRLVVAAADTVLAFFWVAWVKPRWVKPAADEYAQRLLASAQTLADR